MVGKVISFIKKNTLLYQSLISALGDISINFSNYLYHLLMANFLGPVGYGALASLISLTYWFGVPVTALRLVVVKYVSEFFSSPQKNTLPNYRRRMTTKILKLVFLPLVFLIAASFPISKFLHLESFILVAIMVADTFVNVFLTLNTGFLQGMMKFGSVSLATLIQATSKIGLAFVLVNYANIGVLGACLAILTSSILATLISERLTDLSLPRALSKNQKAIFNKREMLLFSLPTILSIIALNSIFTTDIVMARHFLSQEYSGYYASLALLGKIIFFVSSPISRVMFPMSAGCTGNHLQARKLLVNSIFLTILVCIVIGSVYFLFPQVVVNALYGKSFLNASRYLPHFAVFLGLYSCCSLLVNFFLSQKKYFAVYLSLAAALFQPLLILRFHENLSSIVNVSLMVSLFLLVAILLYYKRLLAREK